jgi:hypothetical protein
MVGRAHNCKTSLSGGGESRPAGLDPKVAEAALSSHREGETVATASAGSTGQTGKASSAGMVPQAKSGSDKRSEGASSVTQAGVASGPLNLSSKEQKLMHKALGRSVTIVKRGRPRLEDAKSTLAATKPWDKLGMSERTWYRRQKEKRDLK